MAVNGGRFQILFCWTIWKKKLNFVKAIGITTVNNKKLKGQTWELFFSDILSYFLIESEN